VGLPRQRNLYRLAEQIERDRLPGAVVECGVLDGGMSALMASATAASGRDVHMFDSWRGLPRTTEEDGEAAIKWEGCDVGSRQRVAQCMNQLRIDPVRLHFHAGWFHDTFPSARISDIALLHIDCDFFEPTKRCLEHWYPTVASGGFIQFDDYDGFIGCRKAVDQFMEIHPELQLEFRGESGKACFVRKP
jgi:O-methyltransferase